MITAHSPDLPIISAEENGWETDIGLLDIKSDFLIQS